MVILLPLGIGSPQREVRWGTVDGLVIDSEGRPLPEATVTSYIDAKGATRDVTQHKADAQGRFTFSLPEGSVWLCAHKTSDEYPYPFFAFYMSPGQDFPTVTIKGGEITRGVVIRVGMKAAHLVYETVDESGRPILGRFIFVRVDQPDRPYSTSALAKDDMLVPPVPFRATFEAKGYKPWHYGDENWKTERGLISLKSGQTLNLRIQVQPSPA